MALGGVISMFFLAEVMQVKVSLVSPAVLGLTIWCIYTFDHLVDALKNRGIISGRHKFHKKYHLKLSKLLLFALLAISVLLFFIPYKTLVFGSALTCFVLIYFLSIHLFHWRFVIHKELMIAVIYTLGILLIPFSEIGITIALKQILIGIGFFAIVLINLLLFSLFDHNNDSRAQFPSIINVLGTRYSNWLIILLSAISLVLIAIVYHFDMRHEALVLFSMFIVLESLFWFRKSKTIMVNYRYIGDGVFFLPLIYLL